MSADADAIKELAAAGADLTSPRTVVHYLYLPDRERAASVARTFNRRGFRTEERLGADNINWLVLATHEVLVSEALITATHRAIETLIAQNGGGEYDGWEAEVRAAKPNRPRYRSPILVTSTTRGIAHAKNATFPAWIATANAGDRGPHHPSSVR